jgi:hypothetical protein
MGEFTVEIAKKSDKNEIVDMLVLMHEEVTLFTCDKDSISETVDKLLGSKGGFIGIIRGDDEIEAMIGLNLDRRWYSQQWYLSEMFTFVKPELRRSTRAKCLLEFAKECSEKLNVMLVCGITSNIRTEAKIKLYERQFNKAGSFFVHNRQEVSA